MKKRIPFFSVVGVLVLLAASTYYKVQSDRIASEFDHTGDVRSTRALIDAGRDVNQREALGSTPLMQAARSGKPEAVEALLARKARVDDVDESGRTAMNWALYMFRLSKNRSYTRICELLLDNGASVEHRNNQGRTYLMSALDAGDVDTARSLIKRGADVKAVDKNGNTALMYVMKGALTGEQVTSFCKELLDRGVNPRAKNRRGQTAFDIAKAQDDKETRISGTKALRLLMRP